MFLFIYFVYSMQDFRTAGALGRGGAKGFGEGLGSLHLGEGWSKRLLLGFGVYWVLMGFRVLGLGRAEGLELHCSSSSVSIGHPKP